MYFAHMLNKSIRENTIKLAQQVIRNEKSPQFYISSARKDLSADFSNQFVILTKPEMFFNVKAEQLNLIMKDMFDIFDKHQVLVEHVRLFNNYTINHKQIYQKCYQKLHDVAMKGTAACSEVHKEKLAAIANKENIPFSRIKGAYQFLGSCKKYDESTLNDIVDTIGCIKIGAGIYCIKFKVDGQAYLILNPFYPNQKNCLTRKGSHIFAFSLLSNKSWKYFRKNIVGDIHPYKSSKNSIRWNCYAKQKQYGIKQVDISNNCIHFSANPFDSMYYQLILFNKMLSDTFLIKQAKKYRITLKDIERVFKNKKLIFKNNFIDIRDVCEDRGSRDCIKLLACLKASTQI